MQPLKYYGGKVKLAPWVVSHIPPHVNYVEPFAGGCSVFYAKPRPEGVNGLYREVINDLDSDLTNFYTQLRDTGPALLYNIDLSLFSREDFLESWTKEGTPLERARRYFVRLNQSFAAAGCKINHRAGWATQTLSGDVAKVYQHRIEALPPFVERFKGVYIENRPALECIETWDAPETFFYCDPPYVGTHQRYTHDGFNQEHLNELVKTLTTAKGAWAVSSYADAFDDLAGHIAKHKLILVTKDTTSTMTAKVENRGARTEALLINYRCARWRPEYRRYRKRGAYKCFTGGLDGIYQQTSLF